MTEQSHENQVAEHHTPYHVRRPPSGGVVLAAHPSRTPRSLYADALWLLRIRS
jgi:hypothetical protein